MTDFNANLSIKTVEDLKAIDVVDKFQDENKDFKSGKILVDGKLYNIRAEKHGDRTTLSVEREYYGFLSGFRNKHCSKATSTAIDLCIKLNEIVKSKEYSVVKNSYYKLLNFAKESQKNTIEVADYGFKPNRDLVKDQNVVKAVNEKLQSLNMDKHIKFNKIDAYNTLAKITPRTLMPDNYGDLMKKISNKELKLDPKYFQKVKHTVSDLQLNNYFKFITRPENVKKIDIPKKLFGYMNQKEPLGVNEKQTGWKADFKRNPEQALKNYVIKNSSYEYRNVDDKFINKTVEAFKEFIEIYNIEDEDLKKARMQEFLKPEKWLTEKQLQKYNEDLFDYADEKGMSVEDARESFNQKNYPLFRNKNFLHLTNVLSIATFRQTSKLGLSFFKEQGIPILFQYSDYNHNSLKGKGMQNIRNENFWKNGEISPDTAGSAITHSELRQAFRLQQEFGDEFNIKLAHGGKK